MLSTRIERLYSLLESAGQEALALNPGPSLTYLTGLHFHLMERPVVAFFAPGAAPVLVLPELEMGKTEGLPFAVRAFPYDDNPSHWADAFLQAGRSAGLDGKVLGIEPGRLRVLELRLLEAALPKARFVSAQDSLASLRMQKDASEITAMRQAVDIAQRGLRATLPHIKPGVTEREIAGELFAQMLRAGSDAEMPFSPIVSGGPNGANPHAVPSDRPLKAGDLLVIDWGAAFQGYFSDLTRTFALGAVDAELRKIFEVVKEANAAGRSAARPGLPAGVVDRAARAVIEKAGYGAFFTHRTGHGLGMEAHEEPYMFGENQDALAPGMTFTVEPGIYLPGRGGVRIEDDMVVTAEGAESLSDMERDWKVLG